LEVKKLKYLAKSREDTIKLGKELGAILQKGDVVALVGELGSGKTWFTKGLALGLGISPTIVVTSPSFSLVNEYEGRLTIYHMDLFRLDNLSEVLSAGLEEYLYNGDVVIMEWADRCPEILPERMIKVEFIILDENLRNITISGHHPRAIKIIEGLRSAMGEEANWKKELIEK
jgi:tRNA threonylcarbamoyladenosine biosynthesis protein TsaE